MNGQYKFKGLPYVNVTINDDDNTIRGTSFSGDTYVSPATAQRWRWHISFVGGKDEAVMGNLFSSLTGTRRLQHGRSERIGGAPRVIDIPLPQSIKYSTLPEPGRQNYLIRPGHINGNYDKGTDVVTLISTRENRDLGVGMFIRLDPTIQPNYFGNKVYMITEFLEEPRPFNAHGMDEQRHVRIYPSIQFLRQGFNNPDGGISNFRDGIFNIFEQTATVLSSPTNTTVSTTNGFIQAPAWEFIEYRG